MITRALAIALAGALLAAGIQTLRLSNEQRDHAETMAQRDRDHAAWERGSREAVEAARAEEKRRTAEVQKVADEANKALDLARADAVVATDAGRRLRAQLTALTSSCRAAAGNPGSAKPGASTNTTADLLERVQQRLDEAADGIARFADEARAAGVACQRSYESLIR